MSDPQPVFSEAEYAKTVERFKAALAALPEGSREVIQQRAYQARAYVWGWQDGGGHEHDTAVSFAFGDAYATVAALYQLGRIGVGPNLRDAWRGWRETGHIMDTWMGQPTALDLIDPGPDAP